MSQKLIANDAAVFAQMTRVLLTPEHRLYIDFWDHKPPFIYFFTLPFEVLWGNTSFAINLAAISMALLFAISISAILSYLSASRISVLLAFSLSLYYSLLIVYTRSIETTLLMVSLFTLAFYTFLLARRQIGWITISGFLFALAFMSKQPIITNGLVIPLGIFIILPEHRQKALFLWFFGLALGLGIFVIWGIYEQNLAEMWHYAFAVNFRYSVGQDGDWFFGSDGLRYLLRETLPIILPLFLLAWSSFHHLWQSKVQRPILLILGIWFLTAILGASLGRTFKITYFYQTLPPLLILIAYGSLQLPYFQKLSLFLLFIILWLSPKIYLQEMQIFRDEVENPEATLSVLSYLKEHSQAGDCIWGWGHVSHIYYLSGLFSCTSAFEAAPLMLEDGFDIVANRQQYMEELFQNPPRFHINLSSWSYFPMLQRYFERYRGQRIRELPFPVFAMDYSSLIHTNVNFENLFTMIAYDDFQETELCAGQTVNYSMTWRVMQIPVQHYQLFIQLRNSQTHESIAGLDLSPVDNYPTTAWTQIAEIILSDTLSFNIPSDTLNGQYYVAMGFYNLNTLERLSILNENGEIQGSEFNLAHINLRNPC